MSSTSFFEFWKRFRWVAAVLVVFAVIFFGLRFQRQKKDLIASAVKGRVERYEYQGRSACFLQIKNGKESIEASHLALQENCAEGFALLRGDSVFKRAHSDTLYFWRPRTSGDDSLFIRIISE